MRDGRDLPDLAGSVSPAPGRFVKFFSQGRGRHPSSRCLWTETDLSTRCLSLELSLAFTEAQITGDLAELSFLERPRLLSTATAAKAQLLKVGRTRSQAGLIQDISKIYPGTIR